MISVYLKGISIVAPGIKNWNDAEQILTQKQDYNYVPVEKKLASLLSANENRRCSRTIQLALSAVQQLVEKYPCDYSTLRNIFSSCNGDLNIFHHISRALTQPGRPVSPTKFHNSVHNAPAGYAAIALNSTSPSTSIAAYEDSFANGLLEASIQCVYHHQDCLFTGYDEIPPQPLLSVTPIIDDLAFSLLLSPLKSLENLSEQAIARNLTSLCRLDISLCHGQEITRINHPVRQLIKNNPQAKIFPLLYYIANQQNKTLYFNDNQQQIKVVISGFPGVDVADKTEEGDT